MNSLEKARVMTGLFERMDDIKDRLADAERRVNKVNDIVKKGWTPTAIEALEFAQLEEDRKRLIADYDALRKDWKEFDRKFKEPNDS